MRTGYVGELRYGLLNDARRLDQRALPMMAERYAALAQPRGEPAARPLPPLRLTRAMPSPAHSCCTPRPGRCRHRVVCLCPGAEYGPAKRWPAQHFAELARQLARRGLPGAG